MIRNVEEESLREMLHYAHVDALPEKWKPEKDNQFTIWTRAIVKVRRRSGICDYVVAIRDFFSWEGISVKKELGGFGIAAQVLGIYPYEWLPRSYYPTTYNKEEMIRFIMSYRNEDEEYLKGVSDENLKKMCINISIREMIKDKDIKHSFTGRMVNGYREMNGTKNKEDEENEDNNDSTAETRTGATDGETAGKDNEEQKAECSVRPKAKRIGRQPKSKKA